MYSNDAAIIAQYRKFIPKILYKNNFTIRDEQLESKLHINLIRIPQAPFGSFHVNPIVVDTNNTELNADQLYHMIDKSPYDYVIIDGQTSFRNRYEASKSIIFDINNEVLKELGYGGHIPKNEILSFLLQFSDKKVSPKIKELDFVLSNYFEIHCITNSFFQDEYLVQLIPLLSGDSIRTLNKNALCKIYGSNKYLSECMPLETSCNHLIFFKETENGYLNLNGYYYCTSHDYYLMLKLFIDNNFGIKL